jgi:hypothetical protein
LVGISKRINDVGAAEGVKGIEEGVVVKLDPFKEG